MYCLREIVMKKLAVLLALSASAVAYGATPSFADYSLTILHINDWHSRIESINKFDSTCSAEDEGKGECFGGAARMKTAVDALRKKHEGGNVMLLNAGDNFQGSLFYSQYKGAVEAEFLNLMGFDAMTIGNHEFDDGEPALKTFLNTVKFPVVSANVKPSLKSQLAFRVKPYVVLEVGGQKIGIVGAVANETPEISSPGPEISIEEDVATITAAVAELQGQGVDKIVALTHVGYPRDLAAIAKIPGVDVVVGGHSHTFLANGVDKAEGPYPTMVDNPDGHKVPVVQAASYSKYIGELDLTFDDSGAVTAAAGVPILLDKSFTPDATVLARIVELAKPLEELKNKVVAESAGPIDGTRENCRARECEMGNLVADAMLDRVKSQGIAIAVQNGGGLRASIDAGEVTMGEVLTVLPFQNTLSTFQLSGKDIVASLEAGVSEIEGGKGKFPQVAGLKYSFDRSVAAGQGRIKSVEVKDGDAFKPIEPDKVYGVVSNNFMRAGGDGYKLFKDNAQNAYDFGPNLEVVVADYLAANKPYKPGLDGRITDVTPADFKPAPTEEAKPAEQKPAAPAATGAPAPAMTLDGAPKVEMTDALKKDAMESAAKVDANLQKAAEARAAKEAEEKAKAEAEAKAAAGGTAPAGYTIQAGDNYWDLAGKFYGDSFLWPKLKEANPSYNPKRLEIGASLNVPAK